MHEVLIFMLGLLLWFFVIFKWVTGDVPPQAEVPLEAEGEGHGVTKKENTAVFLQAVMFRSGICGECHYL